MIKHEDIQRIKAAARIEEVVGDFVSLKRRGVNLIGLCPFHNEKTPSFNVNPARGIFKCFGCQKGGDSVSFLMEHEHFTYPEALRYLAEKYHIDIEEESQTAEAIQQQNERDALYDVSKFAAQYFIDTLLENDQGKAIGLSYFMERGLRESTIQKWQLGFSLNEWDGLTAQALKAGYSQEILVKSGLSIANEQHGSLYDRFRERIIFPIHSEGGRVLGFTGRILSAEKSKAKYVNSPESLIYHKSKTLFGIHLAKSHIMKQDLCYLVEGNMDVITLWQNGIENVVASSGTSLTLEQIRLIKRYTKNITILYDGDKAGIKAAMRAIDLLLEQEMQVRVVLFPEGEDPDSYARKISQTELKEFLDQHTKNFILFKIELLSEEVKTADPQKKLALLNDLLASIALIPNLSEREMYVLKCSELLEIKEKSIVADLNKKLIQSYNRKDRDQKPTPPTDHSPDLPPVLPDATEPLPIKENLFYRHIAQEQKVVKLLLRDGDKTTMQPIITVEGKKENYPFPVAKFIIQDLTNDGIEPEEPVCRAIFAIFKEYVLTQDSMPPIELFIHHEQADIVHFVTTVLAEERAISPSWGEKRGIRTPLPSDPSVFNNDIKQSVLSLKVSRVKEQEERKEKELKDENDSQKIDQIAIEVSHLKQIRSFLEKELKRVIS